MQIKLFAIQLPFTSPIHFCCFPIFCCCWAHSTTLTYSHDVWNWDKHPYSNRYTQSCSKFIMKFDYINRPMRDWATNLLTDWMFNRITNRVFIFVRDEWSCTIFGLVCVCVWICGNPFSVYLPFCLLRFFRFHFVFIFLYIQFGRERLSPLQISNKFQQRTNIPKQFHCKSRIPNGRNSRFFVCACECSPLFFFLSSVGV